MITEESTEEFANVVILNKTKTIIQAIKTDREPVEIIPGLYLGSIAPAIFSKGIESFGITHILTAAKGIKPTHVHFQYHLNRN